MEQNELKYFSHPNFGNIRYFIESKKLFFLGSAFAFFIGYTKKKNEYYKALYTYCPNITKKSILTEKSRTHFLVIPEEDALNLILNTNTLRAKYCLKLLTYNGLIKNDKESTPIAPKLMIEEQSLLEMSENRKKRKVEKEFFTIPNYYIDILQDLSDEQLGVIFRACFEYNLTGSVEKISDPIANLAFSFMKIYFDQTA